MITVDVAQIEVLTDLLIDSTAGADEVLNRLRRVSSEIQSDTELAKYTYADNLTEYVSLAIQELNRVTDILMTLKNAMLPVADIYRENEKKNKNALIRMTAYVDSIKTTLISVISADTVPQTVHSDDALYLQRKVQRLVSDSISEMQVTNIAAITRIIEDEYEVTNVKSLETDS